MPCSRVTTYKQAQHRYGNTDWLHLMSCKVPIGLLLIALASLAALADDTDNPPVPEVSDTADASRGSTIRVALVDAGVNYLLPLINNSLARDSQGQLIGFDYWDLDDRPFDSHPNARGTVQRHGTRTAALLLEEAPFVELVAYRYPRPDMQRMADLIEHADQNQVRVIGIPLGGNLAEPWIEFEATARLHPHILFVVSAGNNGRNIDDQPVYPAALDLENLLVVTSADDFGRVAQGVNWGRVSVDYMVPAEGLQTLGFDGSAIRVSGSSYAVPRVVALLARYLRDEATITTAELIKRVRQKFANGAEPRQLAQGYLYDPRFDPQHQIRIIDSHPYEAGRAYSANEMTEQPGNDAGHPLPPRKLPLQVLILDRQWQTAEVMRVLQTAETILSQCAISFSDTIVQVVQAPEYLRDLSTGAARTLFESVRFSGAKRRLTAVFARDTHMSTPFDAEAFGRGNTRDRSWMTDSVWLTLALEDRAIALAHEMFHVLVNSGEHSRVSGSLMLERTTGTNTRLTLAECEMAHERASQLQLLQ